MDNNTWELKSCMYAAEHTFSIESPHFSTQATEEYNGIAFLYMISLFIYSYIQLLELLLLLLLIGIALPAFTLHQAFRGKERICWIYVK